MMDNSSQDQQEMKTAPPFRNVKVRGFIGVQALIQLPKEE
ncbi:hypothetical protein EPIR_2253 [Erwinia piriflorinigrans CFBP 5888]|uniref:Uncharacterized protein n=1 Tax=Erwinia piriflorinigrans CFBP 5888 TaxID=1161919 RepID=V5Z9I7_9GAMM|nr:hypothetical protein EPIR_2253 [Erwinia piriflorinigrans CFBP 5888]